MTRGVKVRPILTDEQYHERVVLPATAAAVCAYAGWRRTEVVIDAPDDRTTLVVHRLNRKNRRNRRLYVSGLTVFTLNNHTVYVN